MGVLSVPCPRCEAKVGKPCNNGTVRSKRSLPCAERRKAYEESRYVPGPHNDIELYHRMTGNE